MADYNFSDTFSIGQVGTNITAVNGWTGVSFYGGLDSDGGFTLTAYWSLGSCSFKSMLATIPHPGYVEASFGSAAVCATYSCTTIWNGTLS